MDPVSAQRVAPVWRDNCTRHYNTIESAQKSDSRHDSPGQRLSDSPDRHAERNSRNSFPLI